MSDRPRPKTLSEVRGSAEEMMQYCLARWVDRGWDWNAFPDAVNEGYRRAQHRYVGGGGSGKHDDPRTIPQAAFNISVMTIPPKQGTTLHRHAVDEAFFLLKGNLTAILEDDDGNRVETVMGPWDCFARPAGVMAAIYNHTAEPAYVQVIMPSGQTVPTEQREHGMVAQGS